MMTRRAWKKLISLFVLFCFVPQSLGFAQGLPLALPMSAPGLFLSPTLKYLSVNEANPNNYFNFLLDRGSDAGSEQQVVLNQEAKKLIHYFFLGITLPDSAFWVNLKPLEPDRITSDELSRTDLGRALLEQDLRLKKDMSQYLNPQNKVGRIFWEKLYSTLGKEQVKKAQITTSNRVWIVPDRAVIVETEDGALVAEAKLKVLLESEYATLQNKKINIGKAGSDQGLQTLTEQLMKEIIIPAITKDVNESQNYAPLRQIYHSLILAQWFKKKHQTVNPYSSFINSGKIQGLNSTVPWEKQEIWQDYLKSYSNGEYKIQDTIFGLKRMYFSGGVSFSGENSISNILVSSPVSEAIAKPGVNSEIKEAFSVSSPVTSSGEGGFDRLKITAQTKTTKKEAPQPRVGALGTESSAAASLNLKVVDGQEIMMGQDGTVALLPDELESLVGVMWDGTVMRDIAQGLSLQPSSVSGSLMFYADKGVLFDSATKVLVDIESGNILDPATGTAVEDRASKPVVINNSDEYQHYLVEHEKLRADMAAKSEQIQRDKRTDSYYKVPQEEKELLGLNKEQHRVHLGLMIYKLKLMRDKSEAMDLGRAESAVLFQLLLPKGDLWSKYKLPFSLVQDPNSGEFILTLGLVPVGKHYEGFPKELNSLVALADQLKEKYSSNIIDRPSAEDGKEHNAVSHKVRIYISQGNAGIISDIVGDLKAISEDKLFALVPAVQWDYFREGQSESETAYSAFSSTGKMNGTVSSPVINEVRRRLAKRTASAVLALGLTLFGMGVNTNVLAGSLEQQAIVQTGSFGQQKTYTLDMLQSQFADLLTKIPQGYSLVPDYVGNVREILVQYESYSTRSFVKDLIELLPDGIDVVVLYNNNRADGRPEEKYISDIMSKSSGKRDVRFVAMSTADKTQLSSWARDPIIPAYSNDGGRPIAISMKDRTIPGRIDYLVPESLKTSKIVSDVIEVPVYLEGGNFLVDQRNGKTTIFMGDNIITNTERSLHPSNVEKKDLPEDVEIMLLPSLSNLSHIDTYVTFISDNTIGEKVALVGSIKDFFDIFYQGDMDQETKAEFTEYLATAISMDSDGKDAKFFRGDFQNARSFIERAVVEDQKVLDNAAERLKSSGYRVVRVPFFGSSKTSVMYSYNNLIFLNKDTLVLPKYGEMSANQVMVGILKSFGYKNILEINMGDAISAMGSARCKTLPILKDFKGGASSPVDGSLGFGARALDWSFRNSAVLVGSLFFAPIAKLLFSETVGVDILLSGIPSFLSWMLFLIPFKEFSKRLSFDDFIMVTIPVIVSAVAAPIGIDIFSSSFHMSNVSMVNTALVVAGIEMWVINFLIKLSDYYQAKMGSSGKRDSKGGNANDRYERAYQWVWAQKMNAILPVLGLSISDLSRDGIKGKLIEKDFELIDKQFRALRFEAHPDRHPPQERQKQTVIFQNIYDAYEFLTQDRPAPSSKTESFVLSQEASSPVVGNNGFNSLVKSMVIATGVVLSILVPSKLVDITPPAQINAVIDSRSVSYLMNEYASMPKIYPAAPELMTALEGAEIDLMGGGRVSKDGAQGTQIMDSHVDRINGLMDRFQQTLNKGEKLYGKDKAQYDVLKAVWDGGKISKNKIKNDLNYSRKVTNLIVQLELAAIAVKGGLKEEAGLGEFELALWPTPIRRALVAYNSGESRADIWAQRWKQVIKDAAKSKKISIERFIKAFPDFESAIHYERTQLYFEALNRAGSAKATLTDLREKQFGKTYEGRVAKKIHEWEAAKKLAQEKIRIAKAIKAKKLKDAQATKLKIKNMAPKKIFKTSSSPVVQSSVSSPAMDRLMDPGARREIAKNLLKEINDRSKLGPLRSTFVADVFYRYINNDLGINMPLEKIFVSPMVGKDLPITYATILGVEISTFTMVQSAGAYPNGTAKQATEETVVDENVIDKILLVLSDRIGVMTQSRSAVVSSPASTVVKNGDLGVFVWNGDATDSHTPIIKQAESFFINTGDLGLFDSAIYPNIGLVTDNLSACTGVAIHIRASANYAAHYGLGHIYISYGRNDRSLADHVQAIHNRLLKNGFDAADIEYIIDYRDDSYSDNLEEEKVQARIPGVIAQFHKRVSEAGEIIDGMRVTSDGSAIDRSYYGKESARYSWQLVSSPVQKAISASSPVDNSFGNKTLLGGQKSQLREVREVYNGPFRVTLAPGPRSANLSFMVVKASDFGFNANRPFIIFKVVNGEIIKDEFKGLRIGEVVSLGKESRSRFSGLDSLFISREHVTISVEEIDGKFVINIKDGNNEKASTNGTLVEWAMPERQDVRLSPAQAMKEDIRKTIASIRDKINGVKIANTSDRGRVIQSNPFPLMDNGKDRKVILKNKINAAEVIQDIEASLGKNDIDEAALKNLADRLNVVGEEIDNILGAFKKYLGVDYNNWDEVKNLGPSPTTKALDAAMKKILFRLHPDRSESVDAQFSPQVSEIMFKYIEPIRKKISSSPIQASASSPVVNEREMARMKEFIAEHGSFIFDIGSVASYGDLYKFLGERDKQFGLDMAEIPAIFSSNEKNKDLRKAIKEMLENAYDAIAGYSDAQYLKTKGIVAPENYRGRIEVKFEIVDDNLKIIVIDNGMGENAPGSEWKSNNKFLYGGGAGQGRENLKWYVRGGGSSTLEFNPGETRAIVSFSLAISTSSPAYVNADKDAKDLFADISSKATLGSISKIVVTPTLTGGLSVVQPATGSIVLLRWIGDEYEAGRISKGELAWLIAHEAAHAEKGHFLKSEELVNRYKANEITKEDVTAALGMLEHEADLRATEIIISLGFSLADAQSIISRLEILKKEGIDKMKIDPEKAKREFEYPSPEERVNYVNQNIKISVSSPAQDVKTSLLAANIKVVLRGRVGQSVLLSDLVKETSRQSGLATLRTEDVVPVINEINKDSKNPYMVEPSSGGNMDIKYKTEALKIKEFFGFSVDSQFLFGLYPNERVWSDKLTVFHEILRDLFRDLNVDGNIDQNQKIRIEKVKVIKAKAIELREKFKQISEISGDMAKTAAIDALASEYGVMEAFNVPYSPERAKEIGAKPTTRLSEFLKLDKSNLQKNDYEPVQLLANIGTVLELTYRLIQTNDEKEGEKIENILSYYAKAHIVFGAIELLGRDILAAKSGNEGGINLSNIELTLKNDKFVSTLNPADLKILRAAKAVKQGWSSLAVLYVHEVRLLLQDNIVKESDMTQRGLLQSLLVQLESKESLDPQTVEFGHVLNAQVILSGRRSESALKN